MALDETKNFAVAVVSTGYDASATSIVLTTGHGARFPTPTTGYSLVWWNYTDYKNPSDDPNVEIVRCTGKSTDTLTVTRAQEGTTAATHNTSGKEYRMTLGITSKMITDIDTKKATLSIANVLDYGAVADNTTDCLTAFTNALASGKKIVFVPAGNYYLSNSITIPTETMLIGDGIWEQAQLRFPNGVGAILCSNDYAGIKNIKILYPSTASSTSNIGINITKKHIYLDHIVIQYAFIGVQAAGTSTWLNSYNFVNTLNCGDGFVISNGNTHMFNECYANNSVKTYYTTAGGYGWNITNSRVVMHGCNVDNAATAGIYVHGTGEAIGTVVADVFTGDNCAVTILVDGSGSWFDFVQGGGTSFSTSTTNGGIIRYIDGNGGFVATNCTNYNGFKATGTASNQPAVSLWSGLANSSARNWGLTANKNAYGDFAIMKSDAKDGDPFNAGTVMLNIGPTGDILLQEGMGIVLDAAGSADEKWTGIAIPGTAGATLAVGDLCYLDVTATEWLLADADAASTAGSVVLGICLIAANDGETSKFLLMGTIRSAAFPASIALGAPVYVSTTAGDITATQPSGTDDVIRVVGWAITAEPNTIYFNPSSNYITHT